MQLLLTPSLIGFLISRHYGFCLVKRDQINRLKPVREVPMAARLPEDFETYYLTAELPAHFPKDQERLTIVELDKLDLVACVGALLQIETKRQQHG